jgi:Zn-dependent M28 family amino/carboxypeptidase
MAKTLSVLAFTGVIVVAGCGRFEKPATSALDVNAFDAQRAYEHVAHQVAFGPRPSGSIRAAQTAAYISEQLKSYGLDVEQQEFTAGTPRGPMQFRNIVGRTRRQSSAPDTLIVLGSHYDTKQMEGVEFVGANDGASSTGVLLEIARVAAEQPNLVFAFFDGEEAMIEYTTEDGLWGSRFFVEDLKGSGKLATVKAMVLLDMIGDVDLHITMPANSTAPLVQRVFDAARAAGYRDYFGIAQTAIVDDNVPFGEAGIPAVNLIDFQFGSAPGLNDHWHTGHDTLDRISVRSLEIAGKTVLQLIGELPKAETLR